MKQLNVRTFNDFNDEGISRRILMEDPVSRVVLVSLRAGQGLPEHAANGPVTVYSVNGRVHFYEGNEFSDMLPGTLVRLAPGKSHRLEAKEDSQLLVTMQKPSDASGWTALAPAGRVMDLRQTPHERRHSTVFYAFDSLAVGEYFFLVNDHDPRPLRMQIEQMRPGEMGWEYEVQGPYEFRIKISRIAAPTAPQQETVMAHCNH